VVDVVDVVVDKPNMPRFKARKLRDAKPRAT
jgi:hypothetical protein